MNLENPFGFFTRVWEPSFEKTKQSEIAELKRVLARSACALNHLEQLLEYRCGKHAYNEVWTLIGACTQELEELECDAE